MTNTTKPVEDWEKDFDEDYMPMTLNGIVYVAKHWEHGNVCGHDEGYACGHRLEGVKDFIRQELETAVINELKNLGDKVLDSKQVMISVLNIIDLLEIRIDSIRKYGLTPEGEVCTKCKGRGYMEAVREDTGQDVDIICPKCLGRKDSDE